MSGSETNSGVLFYVLAALVGMAVGFVTVWSQIRNQSRQAKADMDAAKIDLEKRVRDYLNLKLDNIQMQIKHVREDIARLEKKVSNREDDERRN